MIRAPRPLSRHFKLLSAAVFCVLVGTPSAWALDATSLRARHAALRESLANNPFGRPIHMESRDESGELQGDVYAQIDRPYTVVGPALQDVHHWCDILILHLNVKRCLSSSQKIGEVLTLNIGRKSDQPLDETYGFEFLYKVVAATPDYLQVLMRADQGPLGTKGYRITLEVLDLDTAHSFLHLSYAYSHGIAARMAMRGYLATKGSDKRGFSIIGHQPDGQPIYTGGMRGVIERNTMRYYLAIETYLGALSAPASEQIEKRLSDWHAGVERYPLQLHEIERVDYLDMKRKEIQRQQEPQ